MRSRQHQSQTQAPWLDPLFHLTQISTCGWLASSCEVWYLKIWAVSVFERHDEVGWADGQAGGGIYKRQLCLQVNSHGMLLLRVQTALLWAVTFQMQQSWSSNQRWLLTRVLFICICFYLILTLPSRIVNQNTWFQLPFDVVFFWAVWKCESGCKWTVSSRAGLPQAK